MFYPNFTQNKQGQIGKLFFKTFIMLIIAQKIDFVELIRFYSLQFDYNKKGTVIFTHSALDDVYSFYLLLSD